MIDKPGRYDISFDDYLSDPCPVPSLSRSTIRTLLGKSARHAFYEHPRLNPNPPAEEEAVKFDIGKAAHALFLEGLDAAEVIDADDWRTKAAKEARDEARESGRVPLLRKQYDGVAEMVQAANEALRHSALNLRIPDGDSESTYLWKEDETWLRIRPDWINRDRNIILDYKTTGESARPDSFCRIAVSTGLDIQEALYRRGVHAIDGTEPEFHFMVQEVNPPYLCSFLQLDPAFQEMGRNKVARGIDIWRECMATGNWPGYSLKVATIEAPAWAIAAWEFNSLMMQETSSEMPF